MTSRELDHMLAACRNRPYLDIDAVDAAERIHVQLRHEAASNQRDPDFCHFCFSLVVLIATRHQLELGIEPLDRQHVASHLVDDPVADLEHHGPH